MNIFTNKNRVLIIILCVFVFIELIGLFYMQFFRSFDHQDVKKNNDFQYRETLMCHVIHTTRTRGGLYLPYYDEKTFVRTIQGIEGGKFQYAIAQKGYCE